MNDFRRDVREIERDYYWSLPRLGLAAIALFAVGWLISAAFFPARVVQRAVTPDSIVTSYEFFHDAHRTLEARKAQIKSHRALMTGTSAAEAERLRIELAAIQHACRELAAKYNANSAKIHRGAFRGGSLPETVDVKECE